MRHVFLISLVVLFSCNDGVRTAIDPSNCATDVEVPNIDCNDDACTKELVTIWVEVLDQDGNGVIFDEFSLTNLDTGEEIQINSYINYAIVAGNYIIAEDQMFESVEQQGTCIEFRGSINGELIVRQTFLIGHDCCHVVRWAGPETIRL